MHHFLALPNPKSYHLTPIVLGVPCPISKVEWKGVGDRSRKGKGERGKGKGERGKGKGERGKGKGERGKGKGERGERGKRKEERGKRKG